VGRRVPENAAPELGAVHYVAADLAEPEHVVAQLRPCVAAHGGLTSLIFLQRFRGAGDSWAGEIQTTLSATRFLIDQLTDDFRADGQAAIVAVTSVATRFIATEQPLSYHVAKAGLVQMVRYYAAALGPKGIRVNAVAPCTILKEESRRFYLENAALQKLYRQMTPLGRMGTAEEVAQAIAFLCGPQASFITGQELTVDGGMSLRLHDSLARELAMVE
jgi:NAD(P)-dependent dehydrogenase (short-subunit alcohol dehydrogenase family)